VPRPLLLSIPPGPRPMASRATGVARLTMLVVALASACGDPASPRRYTAPASLHIVSGDEVTDTIAQWLPQPLVLEVRDSTGALLPGTVVRFEPIRTPNPQNPFAGSVDRLLLSPPDSTVARGFLAAVTDAQGRVAVRIQLAQWAGRVGVVASAPEGGAADTAWFTAVPGRPSRIWFVNRDTTLVTGGALDVRTVVADLYGNVRDDLPPLSAGGAITSVNEQRVARAGEPGLGYVAARLENLVDTMRVAVVPNATLAVVEHQTFGNWTLTVISLDGLQRRRLVTTLAQVHMPAWNRAGTEIAYYEGYNGHEGNARLFIVTTAGERRPLLPVMPQYLRTAFMPRFSPDGEWIYFTGDMPYATDPTGHWTSMQVWRVRRDGSDAERLLPSPEGDQGTAWEPDPSPDGRELALTYSGTVSLYDLATGARRSLVEGEFPRFSPAGDAIAYIRIQPGLVSPLYIVGRDGTGARQLTPPGRLYDRFAGHSWSPDGQWIVVRGQSRLELVRVATGEIMLLPYSAGMWQPAFRP
jgi:Tol biopolymer transport system component